MIYRQSSVIAWLKDLSADSGKGSTSGAGVMVKLSGEARSAVGAEAFSTPKAIGDPGQQPSRPVLRRAQSRASLARIGTLRMQLPKLRAVDGKETGR
jgi:hypothetical protein